MFDPIFIEDVAEAFKPLLKHAHEVFSTEGKVHAYMSKCMYMYSDKSHSFFKHVDTREYVKFPRGDE